MKVQTDKPSLKRFLVFWKGVVVIGAVCMMIITMPAQSTLGQGRGQTEPLQAVVRDDQLVDEEMPVYNIKLDEKWQKLIYYLCKKNNLNYEMVLSFFEFESEGFNLSLICANRDSQGRVLSYDYGIAQINSRELEAYRQHAITYCELDRKVKFNPLNPDHGIRAGIGGLAFYRDYWKERGIADEKQLFEYSLNSYNMGADSYKKYVSYTGSTSRNYNRQIFKRKAILENHWSFGQ
ncbi:MAG: hypothetical protein QHH06_04820 [Clostridiales bacterium]|jgi:hypothetical protein|nr:hypothetical protein [Eubacteriales bacterium]MDH7565790.1 hypothetical protein [Clostridiales bacterium]